MAEAITLRIITPEKIVLDTTVDSVQIPALDGSMGILPGHASMVTALGAGELAFSRSGREEIMFVSTGFCEVRENTVRVVSDASESPDNIDLERAEAALERAKNRARGLTQGEESRLSLDTIRANASMRRALMRLRVGKRRR